MRSAAYSSVTAPRHNARNARIARREHRTRLLAERLHLTFKQYRCIIDAQQASPFAIRGECIAGGLPNIRMGNRVELLQLLRIGKNDGAELFAGLISRL